MKLAVFTDIHGNLEALKTIINDIKNKMFNGEEVILKNREFELLAFLAENPGIVFSKEKLFERVWGMNAVSDTATVMVHINRIREKIEPNSAQQMYIETVWGAGYRFHKF